MTSLVSVIIPAYNSERFISQTIESAINQTWKNIEIIIMDDGSTDKSYCVAKKYQSKKIKVFKSEENNGQSSTLNKLLNLTQGDFIQYLDSDDILSKNKIEIQINKLQELGTDLSIASCKWARFYNDDLETANFYDHADYKNYDKALDWLLDSWNGFGTMPPTAWLFPRNLVEKIGKWNESLTLNNDNEYYSRIVTKADKIFFCYEAKFYYRSGNPSLSGRNDRNSYKSLFNVCDLSTRTILEYENSKRTRKASANLWKSFIYLVYPNCPDLVEIAEKKVEELGGSNLKLGGRDTIQILRKIIGWKMTKKLELKYRKFFYNT